jgi:hypothetical protein
MIVLWYLLSILFIAAEIAEIQDTRRNLLEKGYKIHYATDNSSYIVSGNLHTHPNVKRQHKKFKFNGAGYQQLLLIASVEPAHRTVHDVRKHLPIQSFKHLHEHRQSDEGVFLIRILHDRFLNDTVLWFVSHPAVLWVDFYRRHYKNNVDVLGIGTERIPHSYYSREQVITVGDTGLDYNHLYFRSPELPTKMTYDTYNLNQLLNTPTNPKSKVKAYVNVKFGDGLTTLSTDFQDEKNGHGTHVSGSCCGDGEAINQTEIHTLSKIVFFDFGISTQEFLIIPPMITPLMTLSYSLGSRIFTNSWGSSTCEYTFTAMEMDRFMYLHRDYIIVISAGNSGPDSGSVGSPGILKNGITVGASQNTRESFKKSQRRYWSDYEDLFDQNDIISGNYGEENLADFSSRGPACDGRIKPDIVYPGEYVLSSRAGGESSELLWMRGTSMATPGFARLVGMCREILADRYKIFSPTSALVKNIFITSAKWLTGSAQLLALNRNGKINSYFKGKTLNLPDQGFGRATLGPLLRGELDFIDNIPVVENTRYTRSYISTKTYLLKVGLVWTDFPGYMYSSKALVNDFNLIIRIINSTGHVRVIYGNHGEELDNLNPVEKVVHPVLKDEIVFITVQQQGQLTSLHREEFSLVWYTGLQEIQIADNITEYLPPLLCQGDNILYNGACYSSCVLQNLTGIILDNICQCVSHQPCGASEDGTIHISHCFKTYYSNCVKHQKPKTRHVKHRGILQSLSLDKTGQTMSSDIYLTLYFVATFLSLVTYILFFYQ